MSTKLRDQLFQEAVESAFQKLPPSQQESVDKSVANVANTIKTLGARGALELWSKIGIFDKFQSQELSRLLSIIEEKEREQPWQKSLPTASRKMMTSS